MASILVPFTADGVSVTNGDLIGNNSSPAPSITGFYNASFGGNVNTTGNISAGGSLDIDGEASVGGNLTIVGNITFSGGGSITEVTSAYGNFYGNSDGSNALYAGVPGGVVVPGAITSFTGDSNAYMQINAQNQNHGTQASMEYVVTGDLGTDTTDYLDLGFSSSSWDGTQDNSLGTAVAPRDGYMYVQGGGGGGNLVLGTTTSGTKIKFNAGGPNSANTVATIDAGGFTSTGNVTAGHLKGEGGNISNIAVANITGLGNIATINLTGSSSTVLYGNGVFAALSSGATIANGNSNVSITANANVVISTTGNAAVMDIGSDGRVRMLTGPKVIGGNIANSEGYIQFTTGSLTYFAGNVQLLGGGYIKGPAGINVIQLNSPENGSARINGNLAVGASNTGAIYAGTITASGNANIGNIGTAGLITATGNITGGNLVTAGQVSATGNITTTGGTFVGNGAGLTNVTVNAAGNIQGTSSNVSLVAGSYTYTFDNTGILTLPAGGGNEGAEIDFTKAPNSSLSGNTVVIDQYVDRFRFFENGGTNRGVYIDLTQAAASVGTLLNNRVSGYANAGSFVTMDVIKATVTSSGNRGLSLATTTGTITYNIGGTFGSAGSGGGGSGTVNQTLTTTPTSSIFGWSFSQGGDLATYVLSDLTNSKTYRITVQIANGYSNNAIIIERLI